MFWARRVNLVSFTDDNLAAYGNLLSDFNSAYGANLFGFTVTRIRGHFTWWAADSTDVSTSYNLSVGIRPDERVDAAATTQIADTDAEQVLKTPFEDPYSDWMYVRNCLGITDSVQTHSSTREAAENTVEVDIKAQRKFSELSENLYIAAGINTHPGSDVFLRYDLHVLLKQP